MLPTFVIGLREGLEASLIVGIVAAFLRQRGRSDLIRWVLIGIFSAAALCTAVGVVLELVSKSLPQRQQEGLETVIGLVAVAMVTYMVVWMKRHSRTLKGSLEGAAGAALVAGSGLALVAMAFLAVLREGLETVVFLLAAFNETGNGASAAAGALLGIVVSVALGYGIYRGGVRLNLSRFFRATGVVLVLVAAGLLVNAAHTAHEAGWLNIGQQSTFDLSDVVAPGSIRSSLLTGMLGWQSKPVLIEVVAWLLYLVPVGVYVAWPPGKGPSRSTRKILLLGGAATAAVSAVVVAVLAPAAPASNPVTRDGATTVQILSRSADSAVIRTDATAAGEPSDLRARRLSASTYKGVDVDVFRARDASTVAGPGRMTLAELAAANGGRLPLGAAPAGSSSTDTVPVARNALDVATIWVAASTGRILDVRWRQATTLSATFASGTVPIGEPTVTTARLSASTASESAAAARADSADADNRQLLRSLAVVLAGVAVALLLGWLALQRRPAVTTDRAGATEASPERLASSK